MANFFKHNFAPWKGNHTTKIVPVWDGRARVDGRLDKVSVIPEDGDTTLFNDKALRDLVMSSLHLEWYLFMTAGSQALSKTRLGVVNGRVWFALLAHNQQELDTLLPLFRPLLNPRKALMLYPTEGVIALEVNHLRGMKRLVVVGKNIPHPGKEMWVEAILELCQDVGVGLVVV